MNLFEAKRFLKDNGFIISEKIDPNGGNIYRTSNGITTNRSSTNAKTDDDFLNAIHKQKKKMSLEFQKAYWQTIRTLMQEVISGMANSLSNEPISNEELENYVDDAMDEIGDDVHTKMNELWLISQK